MAKINECRDEFIRLIKANAYSHRIHEVFRDFCEIYALSISNAVDRVQWEKREARYMEVIKSYKKEEIERFAEMCVPLTNALESGLNDFLGETFMELDLGSHWHGQYFTPYPVASMMAKIGLFDAEKQIQDRELITIAEPCTGSGVMVIAAADAMLSEGVNYQHYLHVMAVDLDVTAVHMSYIQFSLLGIPAIVIHGNSLSNEVFSKWYTPFHFRGNWNYRLKKANVFQDTPETIKPFMEEVKKDIDERMKTTEGGQGMLF